MVGNRSNFGAQWSAAQTRFSDPLMCEAGLQNQNNSNNQKTNSRQMLVNSGHPCRKLLIFKVFWGRRGKLVAHFKKNKTIKCSKLSLCLTFANDVPAGRNVSLCVISAPQSECGTCFQMPPGSSAFPFAKDVVWHSESGRRFEVPLWEGRAAGAGRGQSLTVMCNEVTRWEQNNKSFEFEVIFS